MVRATDCSPKAELLCFEVQRANTGLQPTLAEPDR